ncbi:hypothetical protein ACA081_00760 [Candidatus Hodgkinia cicadicola]
MPSKRIGIYYGIIKLIMFKDLIERKANNLGDSAGVPGTQLTQS